MTDAPVTLTLDLWAQGHSAAEIAEMVGHASHKAVTRIVEHARQIGDPRAVYHHASLRLIGKGIPERDRFLTPLQKTYRGVKVVALKQKPTIPVCKRGHERTEPGECWPCKKLRDNLRYSAIKGLR
jgi:hypothetical protein